MSDKDFFFDDEDEQPDQEEAPSKKKSGGKSAAKPAAAAVSAAPAQGSFLEQSVTMTVTMLVAACALLVGVIVGILIPAGGSSTVPSPTTDGVISAPALSPEQLGSGELPEGHVPIDGMSTPEAPGTEQPAVEPTGTTEGE